MTLEQGKVGSEAASVLLHAVGAFLMLYHAEYAR